MEDENLLVVDVNPDAGDDALTSPVALAMKGKTELPVPDADVYPGLMDTAKMKEVYKYWVCKAENCETVEEAAEKAGVCVETALYWAERGDWLQQKRRLLKVRAGEQAVALESKRVGMRTEEAMAQIDAAQKLRQAASEMLDGGERTVYDKKTKEDKIVSGLSPMDLKFIADSMKAGGDIIGRFMGMAEPKPGSDMAAATGQEAEDDGGKRMQPLVVVVKGGGLPQVRQTAQGKVIDV